MTISKDDWVLFLDCAEFPRTINNPDKEKDKLEFVIDVNELPEHFIDELLKTPDSFLDSLTAALREIHPGKTHVTYLFKNFAATLRTEKIKINRVRAKNIEKVIVFDGLVRKSTDVLPRLDIAVFRHKDSACSGINQLPQESDELIYPDRCSNCGEDVSEKGWELMEGLSTFDDYQTVDIEEEPEGLKGRQPERIECQLKGMLTKEEVRVGIGERVTVMGVLRVRKKAKKTLFERYVQVLGVDAKGKNYEDSIISDEEIAKFVEMSKSERLLEDLSHAVAPDIHGHDVIKKSIALQMFGGNLFSKRRGDIHIGIVGDPGIGKTLDGESQVVLADGRLMKIKDMCQKFECPENEIIQDGDFAYKARFDVMSMKNGKLVPKVADIVWKKRPDVKTYIIKTKSGRVSRNTPTHPFFSWDGDYNIIKTEDLKVGDKIIIPKRITINGESQPMSDFMRIRKPNCVVSLNLPENTNREFWRFMGLLMGDAYISKKPSVFFTNNNESLINEVYNYAKKIGMNASVQKSRPNKSAMDVIMCSSEFSDMMRNATGCLSKDKHWPEQLFKCPDDEICAALSGLFDAEGSVIIKDRYVEIASASEQLIRETQYFLDRVGVFSSMRTTFNKKYDRNYYRLSIRGEELISFSKKICFSDVDKKSKLETILKSNKYNSNVNVIPNVGKYIRFIRDSMCLKQCDLGLPRTTVAHYEHGNREITFNSLRKIVNTLENENLVGESKIIFENLKNLVESDIRFDEVIEIKIEDSKDEWLYDLQVPGTHNYIANGILVHNSKIANSAEEIGPHVIRASGAPTTSVGLTAAAVQNPLGGFILEAGAAVLADRGLLIIDEFDKMNETARGSLHEIMEDQRVEVNKGGITATLIARCSVLAIMNPSDNRFDNTRSVASQIDLPASLLSRFDLIFALKDKQNEENDRNVAKAMFNGRDGRLSATEYTNEQITKYIMYARYKVREMTTSPEAESLLTDKFIDLRKINKNNTGEDVIAITFRQLDGAARLAEAHAKMRLSNVVEEKDAEVAISIIEHYIKTMCVDDQGYVTTDMVMGGRSKSEKDKSNDLLSMLQRIAEEDLYTRTYTFDELMGKLDNSIDKVTLKKHLEKYHDMGKIYYSGDKKIKIHRV